MRFVTIAFSLFALSAPALAGNVLVVGPGAGQLHDLQDAIILAADGDVILVKSGVYESIRTAGKSVTIIAETGAAVFLPGSIRVKDVGAEKSIVLSGLEAQATFTPSFPEGSAGLFARNCAGALTVQDCLFSTAPTTGFPPTTGVGSLPSAMGLENCAAVSIVRSNLTAGASTTFPGLLVKGGCFVNLSQVHCEGASGRDSMDPGDPYSYAGEGGHGGHGLRHEGSSFVLAAHCAFYGGKGGRASYDTMFCGYGGDGGHGIFGNSSNRPLRLLHCFGLGGAGGSPTSASAPCFGSSCTGHTGEAIYTTPYNWCQSIFNYPPTNFVNLVGSGRLVSGATLVRDTSPLSLTFTGAPGEIVELEASLRKPAFVDTPSQFGVVHIQQPRWRGVGVVPATGTLTQKFKLPDLPVTHPGTTWFVQARFFDPTTGQRRLSNLHTVVELDASF